MHLNAIISFEFDGMFVVPRSLLEPRSRVETVISDGLSGVVAQESQECQLNGITIVKKLQRRNNTCKFLDFLVLTLKGQYHGRFDGLGPNYAKTVITLYLTHKKCSQKAKRKIYQLDFNREGNTTINLSDFFLDSLRTLIFEDAIRTDRRSKLFQCNNIVPQSVWQFPF